MVLDANCLNSERQEQHAKILNFKLNKSLRNSLRKVVSWETAQSIKIIPCFTQPNLNGKFFH